MALSTGYLLLILHTRDMHSDWSSYLRYSCLHVARYQLLGPAWWVGTRPEPKTGVLECGLLYSLTHKSHCCVVMPCPRYSWWCGKRFVNLPSRRRSSLFGPDTEQNSPSGTSLSLVFHHPWLYGMEWIDLLVTSTRAWRQKLSHSRTPRDYVYLLRWARLHS